MWIEQKTEGSRNQRLKLDASPWSFNKSTRKFLKHFSWLLVGFYTGFTFVGFFVPIKELGYQIFIFDLQPWPFFWVGFFTVATYINAGWLREQVCMYMCPYARFQAAMFDHNTLIVSYDPGRGEQRGSRKRDADLAETELGDCIDCQLCVPECPVHAIYADTEVPAHYEEWKEFNTQLHGLGPTLSKKEDALPDALSLEAVQERERTAGWEPVEPEGAA